MSVTRNISAVTRSFYPDIGLAVDTESQEIEVTYTVISVTVNADLSALARVGTKVAGSDETGEISIRFEYSGDGNPITEAEAAIS
ncbi:TPA: hypothetical protein ACK1Z8_003458 [Klebsiella michiganensis]